MDRWIDLMRASDMHKLASTMHVQLPMVKSYLFKSLSVETSVPPWVLLVLY